MNFRFRIRHTPCCASRTLLEKKKRLGGKKEGMQGGKYWPGVIKRTFEGSEGKQKEKGCGSIKGRQNLAGLKS